MYKNCIECKALVDDGHVKNDGNIICHDCLDKQEFNKIAKAIEIAENNGDFQKAMELTRELIKYVN